MLGRNDLCSCGSGKKYKKCCLNNDKAKKIVNTKVESTQTKYIKLYEKLYNYSNQQRFDEERKKAREIFYILDNESTSQKFERLFNTYFMVDYIAESKKVLAVSYYEEFNNQITSSDVEVMRGLFDSFVSIYKIKTKNVDNIVLEDLLTNELVKTQDIRLLENFKENDLIIARVVNIEGVNILVDVTVSISESIKDVIKNDIERLFENYKEVYKEMRMFLTHHTTILYRYIQQLLDQEVASYLQNQLNKPQTQEVKQETTTENKETNNNKESNDVEKECSLVEMLSKNVEEEYLDLCVDFWKNLKESNTELKGSENSWAAAIEYHIKKENKVNVTQNEIAKKYNVSASTLGKRYKEIKA